jgi:alpha,alpha-trehalose phosphorylase (configuration-retaining)
MAVLIYTIQNVLQGVAPKDTQLRPENKQIFERWTEWNYEQFWKGEGGPIDADIVVIDDPQRMRFLVGVKLGLTATSVTALIPIIRRDSPRTKIIFRSHIESK